MSLFKQLPKLRGWIDSRLSSGEPFLILGDFNRRLALAKDDFWGKLNSDGKLRLVTNQSPALCMGYDDSIDHIVTAQGLAPVIEAGSVKKHRLLPFSSEQFKDRKLVGLLKKALSDHCPVSVHVTF